MTASSSRIFIQEEKLFFSLLLSLTRRNNETWLSCLITVVTLFLYDDLITSVPYHQVHWLFYKDNRPRFNPSSKGIWNLRDCIKISTFQYHFCYKIWRQDKKIPPPPQKFKWSFPLWNYLTHDSLINEQWWHWTDR